MNCLPAAVIWDLDGTLIDSAPDICRALNAVLAESGLAALDEAPVRAMIGDGALKLVERGFTAAGVNLDEGSLKDKLDNFMQHYATDPSGRTELFPGAMAALDALSSAGCLQAICTNKPEEISRAVLRDFGIEGHFGAIVGGDSTSRRKPDPLPLSTCLHTIGVSASRAVMIGDSAVDSATARALAMPVGLVTHGYARTDVTTIDADFLVDDLSTLIDLLRGRRRSETQSSSEIT